MFSSFSPQSVFDPEFSFVQAPKPKRSEVYLPLPIIDLLKADVLAPEHVADIDPGRVPADAAVETDESSLVVRGVVHGCKSPRELARRGHVARGRSFLLKRFVRSLVIVFMEERVEAALLA